MTRNFKKYKWLKWEFWPLQIFYIPIYFLYLYYGIRARSFGFFTASNPLMKYGGLTSYSKYNVLKRIDPQYIPKTYLINPPYTSIAAVEKELFFPVIMKPDIGERGFSVEKIKDQQMQREYLSKSKQAILLQEFIDYPIELGVMYHRYPNQDKGQITSVVRKEVLWVEGDGTSTLAQLIEKGERTGYHTKMLFAMHTSELQTILAQGIKKQLSDIGNHSRGATFYDANHLINDQLQTVFDKIARPIQGFYFGRFDLKVTSIEDLYAGKNIKIVELNGANSEPTHIYDPQMLLLKAYKVLYNHWKTLFQISRANHQLGVPYNSIWEVAREMRKYKQER